MSASLFAGLALLSLVGTPYKAEHAKITLDVSAPGGKETAFVDQTPPAYGKNPRPVVHARAGERVKFQWTFTNAYPHKTLTNVVMHFFVAAEAKVGQKELPDLEDDVVVETAFDMDFKPGAKAGGRQTLAIDKPGAYLVRVESRQTGSDHEHFAAIDLVIEPAP
ncbi:MAG: hypothetical protein U0800_04995 [Isosphaeraceae bacterium]